MLQTVHAVFTLLHYTLKRSTNNQHKIIPNLILRGNTRDNNIVQLVLFISQTDYPHFDKFFIKFHSFFVYAREFSNEIFYITKTNRARCKFLIP